MLYKIMELIMQPTKIFRVVDDTFNCGVIAFASTDIQNTLNIILLSLSILSLLIKLGYGIYQKVKAKGINALPEVAQDIDEAKDKIENMTKKGDK